MFQVLEQLNMRKYNIIKLSNGLYRTNSGRAYIRINPDSSFTVFSCDGEDSYRCLSFTIACNKAIGY